MAERLLTLGEARARFARHLQLTINRENTPEHADPERLRALLAPFSPGTAPVRVLYRNARASCELRLGEAWHVRLDDALLSALSEWLTPANVSIIYAS